MIAGIDLGSCVPETHKSLLVGMTAISLGPTLNMIAERVEATAREKDISPKNQRAGYEFTNQVWNVMQSCIVLWLGARSKMLRLPVRHVRTIS